MTDHESKARRLQAAIYASMSYADKYAELVKLRSFAWEIKKAGIMALEPSLCEREVEEKVKRLFLYATT